MKKYFIEIFYKTGDSFSSHDETSELELRWDNLEVIKKNIERIKEHNEWYNNKHTYYTRSNKKSTTKRLKFVSSKYDHSIKLLTDDGNDWCISAFWCGYFETLYSAEIKEIEDPSLSYVTEYGKYKK